jgi:hypothetical protein
MSKPIHYQVGDRVIYQATLEGARSAPEHNGRTATVTHVYPGGRVAMVWDERNPTLDYGALPYEPFLENIQPLHAVLTTHRD